VDAQALVSLTPSLKSKLLDLEKEIERFRMENTELAKLKKEREGLCVSTCCFPYKYILNYN